MNNQKPEDRWRTYVDRIIEEAQERGDFDLPHLKGKRLGEELTEVYAADRAMAHKVLANSGHAPAFLMKKREIDDNLEKERTRLTRYALRRKRLQDAAEQAPSEAHAEALREQAERDWHWAVQQFEKAIPELNRQIDIFNLMNQIPNLHKMKIRIEREIERAQQQVAGIQGIE
jgi:hypothetical protein